MDKDKVADILIEIGTLLELKGENPFKTRAYSNAARTLAGLHEPLEKVVAEKRLGEIKGIGEALEQKITELVQSCRQTICLSSATSGTGDRSRNPWDRSRCPGAGSVPERIRG